MGLGAAADARPCVAEAAECVLAGLLRERPRSTSGRVAEAMEFKVYG